MQPIKDFDHRFTVLRSLIQRGELPTNWYKDSNYTIRFEELEGHVKKIIVLHRQNDHTAVSEYEPLSSRNGSNPDSLFMLKTSERQPLNKQQGG